MPKTAKKAAKKRGRPAKKRGRKPNAVAVIDANIFEIEETPPPPRFRGTTPEVEALKEKIKRTLQQLKPGQAFILPSEHRSAVRKFLSDAYPDKYLTIGTVPGNDAVVRVYLRKPV